ncbi:hypothetical protein OAU25_00680 [Crocinitomicaceae bacterium]|nr:hypothetical protein [Crocinitomicaceae bacterium]
MNWNIKNFWIVALVLVVGVSLTSCKREGCTDPLANNYNEKAKNDDGNCTYDIEENEIVTKAGSITSNETWTSDKIYKLIGKVVVDAGVTLTIQPGTIIKGEQGTGTLASALIVAQGGKINAVGTASQPIIFTSILDNIEIGGLTGTNLSETDQGLWGGVVILGNAPISAADGDALSQIEGVPVSDEFGAFGGNDVSDNSGTLAYVSIRHGGALIGAGNEINGLTLGGVGSGTSISNIEVVANLDDGIEFFGGTVNASNLLVGFHGDDGIDIDMNYAGVVSDFYVINGANSDEALEVDGPEGITNLDGMFTLQNGICIDYLSNPARCDFKSKAQGVINNVWLGEVRIRASYQNNCVDAKTDAFTHLVDASPRLSFVSSEFTSVLVYTTSQNDAQDNDCYNGLSAPADQAAAENAMILETADGMSISDFTPWTWSGVNGKL